MRIAVAFATKKWGGVKSWLIDMAELWQQAGHEVFVYARQQEYVEASQKRLGNGTVSPSGADFSPFTIYWFYKKFQQDTPDILLCNVGKDMTTAGIAAKMLGIPVVQRIGLPEDMRPSLKVKTVHNWIKPQYLSPCAFITQGFLYHVPFVKTAEVTTILNGKMPASYAITTHTPRRFVLTQQLIASKAHDEILQAFAHVMVENAPLEFFVDIVGTGEEAPVLQALAKKLEIEPIVQWHGFSQNVAGFLEQADIFVLPSRSEGLPNTLLEALAHGLLPVCRDVGGVREVLYGEFEQWIVPFDASPEEFSNLLTQALLLPEHELLEWKQKARQLCAERCNSLVQAGKNIEWFQMLIT